MAKEERGIVKYESRGQEVVLTAEIVREFLVTGKKELVTNQEIAYFLGICKARGLNPFLKDCYLVKYDANPAAIITAIDFYRSRARAAADCTGWTSGVICLNKETGELRYSKGLVLPTEELAGGWFRARPTGWAVDCELEVNLSGYTKNNAFWTREKAPTMIAKVAESQGLRRVWPDLFQGTYTEDEMGIDLDAPGGPPPPGSIGDITPKPEEPKLNTTKFDRAVKRLKWDKETMARLDRWLTDTATAASNKSRKVITPDMIKVSCFGRFEEFMAKFKEWQDVNYPAPPEPAAEDNPTEPKEKGKGAAESQGQELAPEQGPDGGGPRSLNDRKDDAGREVVALGIPLRQLSPVHVFTIADINDDNIDALEELIANYAPTRAGGKNNH